MQAAERGSLQYSHKQPKEAHMSYIIAFLLGYAVTFTVAHCLDARVQDDA